MNFTLAIKEYNIQGQKILLFEPDKNAVTESYEKGNIPFPYWSQVWPASIALARFIITNPHYTKGKKVLELASGLGLPAVMAALNATSVIASDYVKEAVTAMQQTATYNHLKNLQVQLLDWYSLPDNLSADVLLLSDVSYDVALFTIQENVIHNFLDQRATVIITTPQRLIAKQAITPLLSFCSHQEEIIVLHNNAEVRITLLVLQKTSF